MKHAPLRYNLGITKILAPTLTLMAGVTSCSGASESTDPQETAQTGSVSQPVVCGATDNRTAITDLNYPHATVGWVSNSATGKSGSATVVDYFKIMTAEHVVAGSPPSAITFFPRANIPKPSTFHGSAKAVRYTMGRDEGDTPIYPDWAIVTLDTDLRTILGADFQTMARVIPDTSLPVSDYGYPGDKPGLAIEQSGGTLTIGQDPIDSTHTDALFSDLDIEPGQSGGPLFRMSGGIAQLIGVTSYPSTAGENTPCVGVNGNVWASGKYFAFAPDNASGVAMAYTGNGRLVAYAGDRDWTLVASRNMLTTSTSSSFSPWMANDSGFSGGARKVAATNLEDKRQQIWVIAPNGDLKTRWQTSVDGPWSGWLVQATGVKDVAATGGTGVTTHLFMLGTDNSVKYVYKTGNANSAWSTVQAIGTVANASAISAHYFGSVHQVYVVNSSGAQTAYGFSGAIGSLSSFGTATGGFRAIGAGVLKDGRANVMAVNGSNVLMRRTRSVSGAWTSWTAMTQANPANTTGFVTVAMGKLTDGSEKVLAVASDGEIFTITETGNDVFSSTWTRFYK